MEEEKWRHDEQEEKQIKKEAPYSRLDGAIIAVSPRESRKHLASISQASRRIRERERERGMGKKALLPHQPSTERNNDNQKKEKNIEKIEYACQRKPEKKPPRKLAESSWQ